MKTQIMHGPAGLTRFTVLAAAILAMPAAPVQAQSSSRAVFVSNNVSGTISSYRISSAGELTLVGHFTSSAYPYAIDLSPDGRFLAVAHASAATTEVVLIYNVYPDGSMDIAGQRAVPDSPLDLVWINNSTLAVTQTRNAADNFVHTYHFDDFFGTLTPVDVEFTGRFGSSLAVAADGAFLYANESVFGGNSNKIRWFSVQPNGALTYAGEVNIGAYYALDLTMSHSGERLYAACGISGDRHAFITMDVDRGTGELTLHPWWPYYSPGNSPAYMTINKDDSILFIGHGTDATVQSFALDELGVPSPAIHSFDVGLQGTIGDIVTMDNLLLVTDESTALDGLAGVYVFDIHPDGTFTPVGPITYDGQARPEAMAVWVPPAATGDVNGDGVTDLNDYPDFTYCLEISGPGVDPQFPHCHAAFDFDFDQDVDCEDFSHFQRLIP
jgi:6-phosphogluconolactonase (cycloisomerase 2 family)